MKVYIVYRDLYVDGIDINSLQVFDNERDALVYSIALKTHKNYNLGYFDVDILEKEII